MSDDLVEAMARGIYHANLREEATPWDDLVATHSDKPGTLGYRALELVRIKARAAIRAAEASGGLVVGKMPEKAASNHSMGLWGDGYNAALAEVRANAVKVEGV
jgi:hypothetical protein